MSSLANFVVQPPSPPPGDLGVFRSAASFQPQPCSRSGAVLVTSWCCALVGTPCPSPGSVLLLGALVGAGCSLWGCWGGPEGCLQGAGPVLAVVKAHVGAPAPPGLVKACLPASKSHWELWQDGKLYPQAVQDWCRAFPQQDALEAGAGRCARVYSIPGPFPFF